MNGRARLLRRPGKAENAGANLAAAAVFANGFINQSVQFAARKGHFIASSLAGIAGDGQFGTSARWGRDEIARARGHELGHLAAGEQGRVAGHFGGEGNFGAVLDGLHSKEGGEQIGTAGDGSVVGKQHGVVVRDKGFDSGAQFGRPGSGVLHQRNLAKTYNHFREQCLIQGAPSDGKARGRRGMRVADGVDVRTHAIEQEVDGEFGGKFAMAGELAATEIGDNEILGSKRAFIHTRGSGENGAIVEPHGKVSFASHDVSAFIEPAACKTDIAAMLLLALRVAGQK